MKKRLPKMKNDRAARALLKKDLSDFISPDLHMEAIGLPPLRIERSEGVSLFEAGSAGRCRLVALRRPTALIFWMS